MLKAKLSEVSAATCISIAAHRMRKVKLWRHSCPVYRTEHRSACHLPVSQLNLCQKLLKAQGAEALQVYRSADACMPADGCSWICICIITGCCGGAEAGSAAGLGSRQCFAAFVATWDTLSTREPDVSTSGAAFPPD